MACPGLNQLADTLYTNTNIVMGNVHDSGKVPQASLMIEAYGRIFGTQDAMYGWDCIITRPLSSHSQRRTAKYSILACAISVYGTASLVFFLSSVFTLPLKLTFINH